MKSSVFSFRKKAAPATEDISLNITAMADIFTIILVFLLKSYATTAMNLAPAKGLSLPQAFAAQNNVEALRVQVLDQGVTVEDESVLPLAMFVFPKTDVGANGVSTALSQALKKYRARQLEIAKLNADVKVDSRIIVIADQRAPYSTIKTVLASAAVHGYTDFKLAVVRPE